MNTRPVYVLMLDHEIQIFQCVLGVFTELDTVGDLQKQLNARSSIYMIEMNYETPPVDEEFVAVKIHHMGNLTVPLHATTTFKQPYSGTLMKTIINPNIEYVKQCASVMDAEIHTLKHFNKTGEIIEPSFAKPGDLILVQVYPSPDDDLETIREMFTRNGFSPLT